MYELKKPLVSNIENYLNVKQRQNWVGATVQGAKIIGGALASMFM